MIKVYKDGVKIGTFKSYVAFADWLDLKPRKNIGTYYIIPSRVTTLASMDKIVYDGAICQAERRGNI